MLCVLFVQPVSSQTYEINVGDKRTFYAPNPPIGTLENADWSCSNSDVWIYENDRGESADVKVSKYFSGTATIKCTETYVWYDGSASTGEHYKRDVISQTYTIVAKPTKVILNREKLELDVYDDFQFTYTTEPSGLEPIIEWHSSNNNVASFNTDSDNPGWLETWSEGTCTITAIGNTGEKDPTCLVTVVDNHWVKPYIDGILKAQGTVKRGTEVVLTSTKSGATIYYTTDESEPTKSSTRYTAPIVVNKTITIKAKAYLGNQESKVSTFNYKVVSHLDGEQFKAKTKEGVDLSYIVKNGYLEVSSGSTYTPAVDKNYSGNITIPYKVDDMIVKTISERSFYGCNITGVVFEEYSSTSVSSKSIGKESFRNCANLKTVTFPHGIKLSEKAFYNCEMLEEISFDGYADYRWCTELFSNCNNLKYIYLHWNSEMGAISDNCFSSQAYNNALLHVPANLISTYKTTGGWKKFKNIVEIGSEQNEKLTLSASPFGGQVAKGTVVTLSAEANGNTVYGCDIYYTLDSSMPSTSSTQYTSSGITINSTCTLKAIAYKDGYEDSDVLTVNYTVRDDLASGDGSLSNPFNAVAATKKAGELGVGETSSQNYYVKGKISSIKYTYSAQYGTATFYISDDGTTNDQFYVYGSYYLENKPWVEGNPQIEIGDAVIVYGKMTNYNGILEMADKQNFVYSHNGKTNINTTPSQKLVLYASPSGGQIAAGTTVTLTAKANGGTVSGCDIYYTLNGTSPSKNNGSKYSYGITINESCTLKSIAYKDGYETSDVLKENYTVETVDGGAIVATCAGVKAGEDGQIYRVTGMVKSVTDYTYGWWYMEDSTGELYIHGTNSGESRLFVLGRLYIDVGDYVTVEGPKATVDGQSELVDAKVVNVQKKSSPKLSLVASLGSGEVTAGTIVTLTAKANGSAVSGCDIYYTLNGTSPSKNNGSKYSYGITINESCTLKAIAYKDGFETSDVLTATYTVEQTPSNEYYYYVGNINGWNVLDATYYFTKMSDGKTWELTMPCDNIYLSNGSADEFKIGTVASLVDGWSVDVYGASDDNPSALRGTMSYINGPNFQVPFVEGMYSYTIRIVPSTMQYEIIVNRKESAEVVIATCAEVNAGTDGTIYRITGNVKSISNTTYGNWYLEDSTGELFIYGTKDKEGNNGKNNSIDIWGIETGDIVTVEGPRQTYNGKVELVDVSILSLQKEKKSVIVVPANGNNSGCYATFYSSRSAYTLPNGLSAQVVTGANNSKLTYKTIADGSVSGIVPKGTAVMLVSDTKQSGTFSLTPTESNTSYSGINLLHGSDESTTTTGDGYHYKLSYGPSGAQWSEVFGWYWGAQEGAPFQIDGRKAWLVVPKSYGTRSLGFTIDGDAADVDINDSSQQIVDEFYDLQGRRVNNPTKKGLYIKNGKKVVK